MKKFLILFLLVAMLVSCSGGSEVSQETNLINGAVYLGNISGNGIYRFEDRGRTCYLADGYEAVAIWCSD